MGGYIYTETMLFTDSEEGEAEGWTTDCGGKKDYDPVIVHLGSRVWRDGTYSSSVIVGGGTYVLETGIVQSPSVIEARAEVERWSREQAAKIIAAVKSAYDATNPPDRRGVMADSDVPFGAPFFLAVCNTKINNMIEDCGLESHSAREDAAVRYAQEQVEEYGLEYTIYHCTPVVRVDPLPKSKVVRLDQEPS